MLRAKDGSLARDWRLVMQGSAVGLVAAVTLLATAIRGLAEPPEIESDGSIRVAKATDVKPRPDVVADNAEAGFFRRPPIDIARLAFGKEGGILVRLGEVLHQPRFAKAAREHDEWLAAFWQKTFPGAEAPPCSLKDIEFIAGDFSLMARYVVPAEDEEDPHPHQMMFGSQCGYIRCQKPVEEVFAWLQGTPGAEVKQHGDVTYVALPLAVLGPAKTCFCRLDDRTLLWSGGERVLERRLDQLATSGPPVWQDAWKDMEGGLFTAVASEATYKDPPETVVDESDKITREFFAKIRLLAVGMDWQPNEHGNTAFKLQFRFDNEADARSIEAGIHRVLEMSIQEAREEAGKAIDAKGKALPTALIDLLKQAKIETRQTEIGWQIEVNLTGPIDIESAL